MGNQAAGGWIYGTAGEHVDLFRTQLRAATCKRRESQVDPGNPEQFCTPLNGLNDGTTLCVGAYPVAWRVEIVDEDEHRGFEYVRLAQTSLDGLERLIDTSFQLLLGN